MNNARGTLTRASTMPSTTVSPVIFSTSQGSANSVNWSPSIDTAPPAISQKKLRSLNRSARAAWVSGGGMGQNSGGGRAGVALAVEQRTHPGEADESLIGR